MVGIAAFIGSPPGAPAPTIVDVQLVSTGSPLPLGPVNEWWLLDGNDSLIGSATTPTLAALASRSHYHR